MKKYFNLLLVIPFFAIAQQKVIRLYEKSAPGSESWNWEENQNNKNAINLLTVYNVVNPTLNVFVPDPSKVNGTGIIVCPGGGFHFLSIEPEGNDVAKWLVDKGYTVFVLKYRTAHIKTEDPFADFRSSFGGKRKEEYVKEMKETMPLSISDGRAAIEYVKKHASDFSIQQDRIGIIGFSAGGAVAAGSAFRYSDNNRPNFCAPIYGALPDSIQGNVMQDAPPMFLVCASDDQLGLAPESISLCNKWLSSKKSVEMHLYAKGGHGFGMRKQNIPTDKWIDRFFDWLQLQGFGSK